MNSRERVLAALNHQPTDRPPRDLGATTATGIHPTAYKALKRSLGMEDQFEFLSSRALLVRVEEPIIQHFGIDVLPIIADASSEPVQLDKDRKYVDGWGVERQMPKDGGHFLVSHPPLVEMSTKGQMAAFAWPTPRTDFSELTQQAKHLRTTTDKALMLNLEVGFLHQSQFMRGYDKWLMDLALDADLAEFYMDLVLEIWLAEAIGMIEATRGLADVVIYADDIAFQNGPMVSKKMYDALLKPRQKQVFDVMTASGMKVLYHSCGSLVTLIDDLVEMGVEALNPVQVSAKGMGDTAELKRRWGKDLTFWGGIDTHKVLPRGSQEDVRNEVWRRLDDLNQDGGYVLATVHDIQAEVPAENIQAMFRAADEWVEKQKG